MTAIAQPRHRRGVRARGVRRRNRRGRRRGSASGPAVPWPAKTLPGPTDPFPTASLATTSTSTTVPVTLAGSTIPPGTVQLTDTTRRIRVNVPNTWTDTSTSPGIRDDGGDRPTVSASVDAVEFRNGWTVPGMWMVAVDPSLDPEALLGNNLYSRACQDGGVVSFANAHFTGLQQRWSNCGGGTTQLLVVSGRPLDGSATVLLQLQTLSPDDPAINLVLDSFSLVPGSEPPAAVDASQPSTVGDVPPSLLHATHHPMPSASGLRPPPRRDGAGRLDRLGRRGAHQRRLLRSAVHLGRAGSRRLQGLRRRRPRGAAAAVPRPLDTAHTARVRRRNLHRRGGADVPHGTTHRLPPTWTGCDGTDTGRSSSPPHPPTTRAPSCSRSTCPTPTTHRSPSPSARSSSSSRRGPAGPRSGRHVAGARRRRRRYAATASRPRLDDTAWDDVAVPGHWRS